MRTHEKIYDRTVKHRRVRSLDKTLDERLSRFFFIVLFIVAIGSFAADGGLLQPTFGVKTTPQKTRLRSANSTRNSRTGPN